MADPAEQFATDQAPLCPGPDPQPRPPRRFDPPPGAVDCHAHVIGLPPRYPLVAARSYTAPEAPLAAYLAMLDTVGLAHGVLVQTSVHGTDNRLLSETLLGSKYRLRGIAVVEPDVDELELERLASAGVVGCRINVLFGGGLGVDRLESLAQRILPLGWHMQLLIDAKHITELAPRIAKLPVACVIDHMGYVPAHEGAKHPGFQALLRLVKDANVWVKLSGAYRLAPPPYLGTIAMAKALIAARPDRLVWGSDWPHVAHKGPMPNVGELLDLLVEWAPDAATRDRILVDNARQLYGFPSLGPRE